MRVRTGIYLRWTTLFFFVFLVFCFVIGSVLGFDRLASCHKNYFILLIVFLGKCDNLDVSSFIHTLR